MKTSFAQKNTRQHQIIKFYIEKPAYHAFRLREIFIFLHNNKFINYIILLKNENNVSF